MYKMIYSYLNETREVAMKQFSSSVVRDTWAKIKELATKEPVLIFQRYEKDDLVLLSKKQYDELKEGK